MIYKLSLALETDLTNIWLYTVEHWSREQANRYVDLILDEIEYLCRQPDAGSDYDHLRKGYLRAKVKSHLIFYKVSKKNDVLEVIRILHQMMDIDYQLDL